MAERFASDLGFILLVLIIAAILGFIIGWLLRKSKINALQAELDTCRKNCSDLKVKSETSAPVKEKPLAKAPVSKHVAVSSNFDASAAKAAYGKRIKEDDLTVVEGIGPKIQQLMKDGGISTWQIMSETSASKMQEILKEGGDRFAFHKPDTWAKQAGMAAKGEWEKLKKWQDELDGGRTK